ncbi:DDE-type integrase/transposase/recombinase [Streptomyces virginiae]|uniref:DDE-type integrase/transposase/recombinase n=1 Tax=Streptomyces virginiae TaxID=1961 RepID=UPI0036CC9B9F
MQRLLAGADWDADEVRDDVRCVGEHRWPGGVLIVDDTGFIKNGSTSAGVRRQYAGTSVKIDGQRCEAALSHGRRRPRLPPAGWAIADHMRTELVVDALAAAERTRGSLDGAIMHTDHGSRHTSRAFAEICRSAGVRQSTGTVGSSADVAAAESFDAAFKRETPKGRKGRSSKCEARLDAFRRPTRYNTRRRHTPASASSPRTPTRTTSSQQQLP